MAHKFPNFVIVVLRYFKTSQVVGGTSVGGNSPDFRCRQVAEERMLNGKIVEKSPTGNFQGQLRISANKRTPTSNSICRAVSSGSHKPSGLMSDECRTHARYQPIPLVVVRIIPMR